MAEFEERKKFWNVFYSPLVFIILLVAFVFMAKAAWGVYSHEKVSVQDRERYENELATANQRQTVLKGQIAVLQTQKGVDDEIRSKFNVTRPGEKVAMIVVGTDSAGTTTASSTGKTWWQEFFGFFGG